VAIKGILCITGVSSLVFGLAAAPRAHEVRGVQSSYACKRDEAVAFLRSPNPGADNRDFPLEVVDLFGNPTGEHIVVISLQNSSAFDARVTAVGFAWGTTRPFKLVELHRGYNEFATSQVVVVGNRKITMRTGTIGPVDHDVVPSVTMAPSQPNVSFSMSGPVHGVPDFPHTFLSFALVTGQTFPGGKPDAGLDADGIRHQIAFRGVVPRRADDQTLPDIEELLNHVYVRFRQVGPAGAGSDTGIWNSLLPPACP
jgi:hypothetical protein